LISGPFYWQAISMSIENLVTVKRSQRARRVALRLDPRERTVNLVVPSRMPLEKAFYFAKTHEKWVREALNNLEPMIRFKNGVTLPILGKNVTLKIIKDKTLKKTSIIRTPRSLIVYTSQDDPTNRITTYLKKIAREALKDMAEEKAMIIRRRISSVTVRDTKTRWGSCAQDRSLSFSWRLIFAPMAAIDYVVAHEVSHLIHMDHGEGFWKLCEALSDNYDKGKGWMQENGNQLMRYGG
jgi:predicted metal-dependent hydrolase